MKRTNHANTQIARAVLAHREAQRLSEETREQQAKEYNESQIRHLEDRCRLIDESLSLVLEGKDPVILVNMVKARFNGKPLPLHCNDRSLDENTSGRDAFYNLANDLEYGLQLRGTEHLSRSLANA